MVSLDRDPELEAGRSPSLFLEDHQLVLIGSKKRARRLRGTYYRERDAAFRRPLFFA